MSKVAIIYSTFPDTAAAHKAAEKLVSERLAACANIFPTGQSVYRWDGKIKNQSEVVAIFKTSITLTEKAIQRLEQLHPYECPCVLHLNSVPVNPAYENWVLGNV